jgi:hypothetical protein
MATLARPQSGLNSERRFFTGMAAAMLVTVLIGFAPTYYLFPWLHADTARGVAGGTNLTPLVHVHAALFSTWILLFLAQTGLVSARRLDLHRSLGRVSLVLAPAVFVAGIWLAIDSGRRGSTPPAWPNAEAFLPVPLVSIILFGGFVAAGLTWRRRPDYHKRLMLLGTMAMLVPALARIIRMVQPSFLPFGVRGALVVLNLYLLALIVFDLSRRGRLHPVTLWGAAIFLVTWPLRLTIGYSDAWQGFAHFLLT